MSIKGDQNLNVFYLFIFARSAAQFFEKLRVLQRKLAKINIKGDQNLNFFFIFCKMPLMYFKNCKIKDQKILKNKCHFAM